MALHPCNNPQCPDKRKNPNNRHRTATCPYQKASTTGLLGGGNISTTPSESLPIDEVVDALQSRLGGEFWMEPYIDRLGREMKESSTPTQVKALDTTYSVLEQLEEGDLDSAAEIYHKRFPKGHEEAEKLEYVTEKALAKEILSGVGRPEVPNTGRNERVLGLETASKAVVDDYNYSESEEKNTEFEEDVKDILDYSIDRVKSGKFRDEEFAELLRDYSLGERTGDFINSYPDHEKLTALLAPDGPNFNQQLYLSTVFPNKELKDEMDRLDITGVSASPVFNCRENGIAYTTLTPTGDTRTFVVYEHRNSDSIIVNGKENWDGEGLPYAGDDKHTYFAEFPPEEFGVLADTLSFFLKSAQDGSLPDDESLAKSATHRDWLSIYRKQIPSFYEMLRQRNPEIDRRERERENRTLRGEPDDFWDIVNPI